MRIIKVQAESNGFHDNKLGTVTVVPDGYAVIPDSMDLTEYFPFVDITVDNSAPPVVVQIVKHEKIAQPTLRKLQEQIAMLEDAACESDAANDARMSTIEDALCEMDSAGSEGV